MKMAAFNAICPLEIGDKVIKVQGSNEVVYIPANRIKAVFIQGPAQVHTVTDIACTHYIKAGKIAFSYELDNSGGYAELEVKVLA